MPTDGTSAPDSTPVGPHGEPLRPVDAAALADLTPTIAAQTATSDVAAGAMACPPFGMHNEALVGGVACGIRSKSLQELLGHVGGPVLGVDAEPEGEVGAEDHC